MRYAKIPKVTYLYLLNMIRFTALYKNKFTSNRKIKKINKNSQINIIILVASLLSNKKKSTKIP